MKSIVFVAVLAVAVAMPQKDVVRILKQSFDMDNQGNYEHGYVQDDGQEVSEVGRVEPGPEPETGSITMEGSYQYVGDDGNTYKVTYLANSDGGFQPVYAHEGKAPEQLPEYAQHRQEYPDLY